MRRRLSDEQIIGMIKEYEAGVKAQGLCRTSWIGTACLNVGRVSWLTCIDLSSSIKSRIRAMKHYASGCANWQMSAAGSGIAVWASCWLEKALK